MAYWKACPGIPRSSSLARESSAVWLDLSSSASKLRAFEERVPAQTVTPIPRALIFEIQLKVCFTERLVAQHSAAFNIRFWSRREACVAR